MSCLQCYSGIRDWDTGHCYECALKTEKKIAQLEAEIERLKVNLSSSTAAFATLDEMHEKLEARAEAAEARVGNEMTTIKGAIDLNLIAELGAQERTVLQLVLEGLHEGQKVYGQVDVKKDPRDFKFETLRELRDGVVYITLELMRFMEEYK